MECGVNFYLKSTEFLDLRVLLQKYHTSILSLQSLVFPFTILIFEDLFIFCLIFPNYKFFIFLKEIQ